MGSSQSTELGQNVDASAQRLAAGLGAAAQRVTDVTQASGQLSQATVASLNAFKLAMANLQRTGTVVGGDACGGFYGGDDEADPAQALREYEASLSAKAKEDVIRRLGRALKRAGIAVDPEADLDTVVRQLVDNIPNPRRGKTFSAEARAQEKVCRTVADVLNDEFTPGVTDAAAKFIDTSLGPVEICRAVGEWAHSFASGVNTEFLAVHRSVRNALQAVTVLDEIMSGAFARINAALEGSSAARGLDALREIYLRAQSERRRQEEVLKNILHAQLAPAARELEIALRDEAEQSALVKRLGLQPGTSEFADSLASAIAGLGTAASIAQRVHRALKQVGLSARQYLDSEGFAALERALDAKIESGSVPADELNAFLDAIQTLRLGFSGRGEARFREALEEAGKTGGRRGGADDLSVDSRVQRARSEKSQIVKEFVGRVSRHYDELLAAVKALSPELGRAIPLNEKTDSLRDALVRLRDMREARLELALVGYYADAQARERKERFLSALRLVAAACETLMELEMFRAASAHLARLKAAIDGVSKTIDYFSDVLVKKFGGEDAPVEGGADDDLLPEIARSANSLNEAVSEFVYMYYVARIRANLDQTSKELDMYGERYMDLLGNAVAARLWTLGQEREAIMRRLTQAERGAGRPLAAVFPATPAGDAAFAAAKSWVEQEFEVKSRFYKALQAVDLYMKAFTAAITKDPDAVRDIKKCLDGTQVIARWFSEQTGDSICRAFDSMGSTNFGGAVAPAADGTTVNGNGATQHYYTKVGAATAAGNMALGIPQVGVAADTATQAKKAVQDAVDNYQALKNLVNAFARVGDRFGGAELRSQVFMSPTQIYKVLVDYLKQSAMSINAGVGATAPGNLGLPLQVPGAAAAADIAAAVTPYQVYFGSVRPGVAAALGAKTVGNYEVEDRYFSLIIKAMAAKIMTTLGVYDMFERRSPIYELTPTRLIVGGADGDAGSDPEAVEGACELYFRLPRLVEFYRAFLRWDGSGTDPHRVAMLPELEGVFGGIIRIVFQKMSSPESGDYSDSELLAVIREINSIYDHFHAKEPGRAIQAATAAFITEINRRYGIIKRDDMAKYWDLVRRARRVGDFGDYNKTSYAILPGEDESEIDRRAPSDRYVFPGSPDSPAAPGSMPEGLRGQAQLDTEHGAQGYRALLRKFRSDIEKEFESAVTGPTGVRNTALFGATSFNLKIKQAEAEMRRAASKTEKLAVAMKLIQGTNVTSLDANKAFMFHETVVVGLNMLGAIHSMITQLSDRIDGLNPANIEGAIMSAIHSQSAVVAGLGAAFAKPALLALDGGKANPFDRYILAGNTASLPGAAGTLLWNRGGLASAIGTNHLYQFMRLESILIGTVAAGAQLPDDPISYAGQASPAGLTAAQLRTLRAYRLFARFTTDYHSAMRDLIENLFSLSNSFGGLVEVRFPQGAAQVQVNFSKLRNVAETLLSEVKYYLDMFRPHLSRDTIKRFEDITVPGSVFWLENNLVDTLFRGKSEDAADQKVTLEGLSRRISAAYANLTRDTFVPLEGAITQVAVIAAGGGGPAAAQAAITGNDGARGAIIVAPSAANAETRTETYGRTLSEIAFYDASHPDAVSGTTGAALTAALSDNYSLGGLIRLPRVGAAAPAEPVSRGGNALMRFRIFDEGQGMTRQRSLLFAFNQLLAHYLSVLSDPAGVKRIYLNLINAFANGTASRSVTEPPGNSFPDLTEAAEPFGRRGDPRPGAVVLQSLAYVLQRLVKDVNPATQVSEHLVNTLADVPLYLKESFRANLPGFVRLFDLVVQKAEFLKMFVQKTNINCGRQNQQAFGAAAGTKIRAGANDRNDADNEYQAGSLLALEDLDAPLAGAAVGTNVLRLGQTSDTMKVRLVAILEAISTQAYTLSSAATEVLKELGDQPVYLQTQEAFIETYKSRYGKMPLMPLSLSLFYLGDLPVVAAAGAAPAYVNDAKLSPQVALGEPLFKVQYGTRGLVMRPDPIAYGDIPGVKAALDAYNGISAKREQISLDNHLSFVRNVTALLRFITESRNYKSMLSTSMSVFGYDSLVGGAIVAFAPAAPGAGNASFAINKDAQTIVTAVESSNQEDEAARITEVVGGTTTSIQNRRLERILNLIDMNAIPINVHALMRDVPLANLYNYEYTFEQMVAALWGESASRYTDPADPNYVSDARTANTRQMLLRLLVDPYLNLDATSVASGIKLYGSDVMDLGTGGYVHRIFRGDNILGLGRPKFLSDQIFNKALFGSVYQATEDFDEAGPGVGAGISRGRAEVGLQPAPFAEAFARATNAANISLTLARHLIGVATAAALAAGGALDDGAAGDVAAGNALAAAAVVVLTGAQLGTIKAELAEAARMTRALADAGIGGAPAIAVAQGLEAVLAPAAGAAFWPGAAPGGAPYQPPDALTNLEQLIAARTASRVPPGGAPPPGSSFRMRYIMDALRNATPAGAIAGGPPPASYDYIDSLRNAAGFGGVANNSLRALNAANLAAAAQLPATALYWAMQTGRRAQRLTYLSLPAAGAAPEAAVNEVDLTTAARKARLEAIGRARFDTRFVRNLFFITSTLRLVRMKLNRELTQSRNVLVSSHSAVAPGVTEYGSDPFTPNEVLESTYPNGAARFNDSDAF